MPDKKTSITLTDDTYKLLVKLCELHTRSQSNMIEVLIKEAAKKEKIKP